MRVVLWCPHGFVSWRVTCVGFRAGGAGGPLCWLWFSVAWLDACWVAPPSPSAGVVAGGGLMAALVEMERVDAYISLRQRGNSKKRAAELAGVSRSWAQEFERDRLSPEIRATFVSPAERRRTRSAEMPKPSERLGDEARRALEDFEFFRGRYFGRRSSPWQIEAGQLCKDLLATDDKEFVVINCPPGAGKSTLLHDIVVWLIVRDRAVRVLMGSRTERQAVGYASRVKKALERRALMQAKDDERRMGLAVDAEGVLLKDFGPFKPTTQGDIWRREMFTVIQSGETPTDEKESTVSAFGQDSGQLGWRVNAIFWDDLVDRSTVKTEAALESQRQWYEDEAETRLEPGGLLVLCGQRIAANDLYRHCLDMPAASVTELDAGDDEDVDLSEGPRKYHHIVYKAHDEDRCAALGKDPSKHKPTAGKPWPEGCLLDPVRVPWRELRHLMGSREQKFRVLYQQEDVDPAAVLVPRLWVEGGRDATSGQVFPGCWDKDRRIGEIPSGLRPPLISIASADPSPSRYWAIGWWIYQPATGFRYLVDLERRAMDAPEFLDWSQSTGTHSGIMESWQRRSKGMGVPIQWWVIEQNAAQRWLFQFEHFRTWQAKHGVRVIGHDTHGVNKADPEFGLEGRLKPIFRDGLIRLPGSQDGVTRTASMKLVDEATRYPDCTTDDTLMMTWFMEHNLRQMSAIDPALQPKTWTPGFIKEAA